MQKATSTFGTTRESQALSKIELNFYSQIFHYFIKFHLSQIFMLKKYNLGIFTTFIVLQVDFCGSKDLMFKGQD